jgi:hypothetical protein
VFKHALSSIRFTLKAAADYNPTTLIVKKIELLNVVSKGSFDQNLADADDATSAKGVWTLSTEDSDKKIYTVDLPSTDGITLSSTEVKYANNAQVAAPVSANGKQVTDFILLPQTLDDVQLRVTFTLQNDQMAKPIEQVLTKKLITHLNTKCLIGILNYASRSDTIHIFKWHQYNSFVLKTNYFRINVSRSVL